MLTKISGSPVDDPTYGDSSDLTRRARLQAAQLNQFWSRWRHDYLTSLREHHRASGHNTQQIRRGDVVLVHDDCPRISWKLAVVEGLLRGLFGQLIRTANGSTNRPIARLIPLEVVANSTEDDSTPPVNEGPNDSATCPKRRVAERGRDKVRCWVKELGGAPEDVTD